MNIAWIIIEKDGKHGLVLRCEDCNIELRIPHKEFKAFFVLDKPYPKGTKKKNKEIKKIEGNLVEVDFKKRK